MCSDELTRAIRVGGGVCATNDLDTFPMVCLRPLFPMLYIICVYN